MISSFRLSAQSGSPLATNVVKTAVAWVGLSSGCTLCAFPADRACWVLIAYLLPLFIMSLICMSR